MQKAGDMRRGILLIGQERLNRNFEVGHHQHSIGAVIVDLFNIGVIRMQDVDIGGHPTVCRGKASRFGNRVHH